jgi:hypothetical protein
MLPTAMPCTTPWRVASARRHTNVLAYAADADSQFHTACRDWLERQRARPDAWYTTGRA